MIGLVAGASVLLIAIVVGVMWVSANNTEIGLRNAIEAKQMDNTSEFDNMWKKIKQTAQVTDAAKTALQEIFIEHAKARSTGGGGGLAKWVQESVPNIQPDSMPFKNLMNIITSSRDRWTMRQKELLDLSREHNNVLGKFPSSVFVGSRGKIEIQIVTSGRTKEAFESGEDEDIDVFGK
jgi:hypothetical protein